MYSSVVIPPLLYKSSIARISQGYKQFDIIVLGGKEVNSLKTICSAVIDDETERKSFIEDLQSLGYKPQEFNGNMVKVFYPSGLGTPSVIRLLCKFDELPGETEIHYRRD